MTERKTIFDDLVSLSEMAEILGVSERTVQRQIREGKLPPTMKLPGRRRFWTRSTIESFLKENEGTFSAQEVGDRLGISRSTARRYLEFLTLSERVVVEYAYRRVGRPEKRYRMALL